MGKTAWYREQLGGQQNRLKAERQRATKTGQAHKRALIADYRKRQAQRPAEKTAGQPATPSSAKEDHLQAAFKAKRKENRQQAKRLADLEARLAERTRELKAIQVERQRAVHETQNLRDQLAAQQAQVARQAEQVADQQARLNAVARQMATVWQWTALNGIYVAAYQKLAARVQQVQRQKHDEYLAWEVKHANYREALNVARRQSDLKQRLHWAGEANSTLQDQVRLLESRLSIAHADRDKALREQSLGGTSSDLALRNWVNRLLRQGDLEDLNWLPQTFHQYRHLRIAALLAAESVTVSFGYFVRVQHRAVFKTVDGRVYTQYVLTKGQPRTDTVYRALVEGERVTIDRMYLDVQPQKLALAHVENLHRRAQPDHFATWLPEDAATVLRGKRVLIVTWQHAQILTRALRYFGAEPLVVNDKERATPWIKARAESAKTDLTFLMSEGLSHHVLETIDKQTIKQRDDLILLYNERPELVLKRCYAYFRP